MVYGYVSSANGNITHMYSQFQMIKLYCKENGYCLAYCIEDEGNGLTIRENLKDLLNNLNKGDIIIVQDYSRLTRSIYYFHEVINIIKDKGAELKSINQPHIDDGLIELSIASLLNKNVEEKIAQRIRQVLK